MTVSITPTELTITAATPINATIDVSSEDEVISKVTCKRKTGVNTSGINFSVSGNSIRFTGNYTGPFSISGVYVSKGSSDLIQTPKTASLGSIPPYSRADLFRITQLSTPSVTISQAFIINIETDVGTTVIYLDVIVLNNYVAGYNFLKNYFPN